MTRYASRSVSSPWGVLGVIGLVVGISILVGFVSSAGNWKLAALMVGALVGIPLAMSSKVLLWLVIGIGMIIAGLARLYLPDAQLIRWAVVPAALLLAAHGIVHRFLGPVPPGGRVIPSTVWWALGFVFVAVGSTVLNSTNVLTAVTGFKGYFQVWGLLIGLALVKWPQDIIDRLPRVMLAIAFLQLPFVLHQYFVIVPTRTGLGGGIVPVDIVSGTFGAAGWEVVPTQRFPHS